MLMVQAVLTSVRAAPFLPVEADLGLLECAYNNIPFATGGESKSQVFVHDGSCREDVGKRIRRSRHTQQWRARVCECELRGRHLSRRRNGSLC